MCLPLLAIPCSVCRGVAVVLRPPELPTDVRGFLVPLVKLASLKYGERLELPKSGNLFELVEPSALSTMLELICASCAANLARLDVLDALTS
jgi:hypothetical protein